MDTRADSTFLSCPLLMLHHIMIKDYDGGIRTHTHTHTHQVKDYLHSIALSRDLKDDGLSLK